MSDILQGNKLHPLIFAEQIINGVPIIWDLDGKQRCTNAYLFFKNGYKVSEFRNGTVNRVVVESIMAANYLDKWNKLEDMCQYIKEHGSLSVFEEFEDMVERMEKAVSSEVADMFDSKDSFLWFGLFARFVKTEAGDARFVAFMAEFARSLHGKKINGVSFDTIIEETKATKDKGIVTKKINHLEALLKVYLRAEMKAAS